MKKFVTTFLFNPSLTCVVLIRKTKPIWMAGKLNAPGGHVEENEPLLVAASREFLEETGLSHQNWTSFLELHRPESDGSRIITFYWGISKDIYKVNGEIEQAFIYDVQSLLYRQDVVKDLLWILVMAREAARQHETYTLNLVAQDKGPEAEWEKID